MKNYSKKLVLLFGALSALSTGVTLAQAPATLLKDINPGSGTGLSFTNASATLDGKVYFVADKDGYQDLLWVTDGTTDGTKQVASASIAAGVEELVSNGSRIIFEAYSGSAPGLLTTNAAGSSALPLRLFDNHEIFNLYAREQDGKVLFAVEPFAGGGSQFWVSNGTGAGTVKLGDFEMKEEFMYHSPYLDKTIVAEQSTNFDQAPPLMTDGTPDGTQLLKDAMSSVANFYSIGGAVGAGDLLFITGLVDDGGFLYNKAFAVDSIGAQEFSVSGDVRRAFKSGDFYYIVTEYAVHRYDKTANETKLLHDEYNYFSEPVLAASGKLYFVAADDQVWETDGTADGTQKRSSTGIGNFNYDPRIWVFGDSLFHSSDVSGKQIRLVDLNTAADILFADVYPASGLSVTPRLWKFGTTFVFPRYTNAQGYELWASPMPVSGVFDPAPVAEPLVISPNPCAGWCRLSGLPAGAAAEISIFDAGGRLVSRVKRTENYGLDLSTLQRGLYNVVATDKNGKIYQGTVAKQ